MSASYPVFVVSTPLARFASWQELLEAQTSMASTIKDFTQYLKDDGDAMGGYEYQTTPTHDFGRGFSVCHIALPKSNRPYS